MSSCEEANQTGITQTPPRARRRWRGQRELRRELLGDIEQQYLARVQDQRVPHRFVLLNGAQHDGVVCRFDRYVIEVRCLDRPVVVVIRKLALAYYYSLGEL